MNRNSALLWLPKIEEAGLSVPQTVIVPYSHTEILPLFDNEACPEFERLSGAVEEAIGSIGYPVFVRSDLTSAKHAGPRAYRIEDPSKIRSVLFKTLEDNELKFWLERDGPKAILVRKFLTLPAPFTAFRGLPISREFRFFAQPDRIICYHPYWPDEAIQDHIDGGYGGWREDLPEVHRLADEAFDGLAAMAIKAAEACGHGPWSVDFAEDDNGKWWLLDMATAADSWHWTGCQALQAVLEKTGK